MNSAGISILFFLVITFIIQQEPAKANNDANVLDSQSLCTSCVSYLTEIQDIRSELTPAGTLPLVKEKLKDLMKANCHPRSPAPSFHLEYCLKRVDALQETEMIDLMNQIAADVKNGPLPRSVSSSQKVCSLMGLCSIQDGGCTLCLQVSQDSRFAYRNQTEVNNGRVNMTALFDDFCICKSRAENNYSCSQCEFTKHLTSKDTNDYKGYCDVNCTTMVRQHFTEFEKFVKTQDNVLAWNFCDKLNACSLDKI